VRSKSKKGKEGGKKANMEREKRKKIEQ